MHSNSRSMFPFVAPHGGAMSWSPLGLVNQMNKETAFINIVTQQSTK